MDRVSLFGRRQCKMCRRGRGRRSEVKRHILTEHPGSLIARQLKSISSRRQSEPSRSQVAA